MARSLIRQGVSVDIVATLDPAEASERNITFGEPLDLGGFTVRYFKRQTHFYKASMPMLRWLSDNVGNYDVVHNHAVFSFAPLAGAFCARRARVPYIIRPLGLLNHWGLENRRKVLKKLSLRLFDLPALRHAAAIHFTSDREQSEAAALALATKSVVIPIGIDAEPFETLPGPQRFLEKFPAAAGKRILLFMSRIDPKKGIELLLQAFARTCAKTSDIMLVVVGSGTETYEASLKHLAAELNLGNRVLWTGFLDGEDKLSVLSAAEIYFLPSYSENFGIALVEAMAAGLPCIATSHVAIAEDAAKHGAVIQVPSEVDAIAQATDRLLANPSEGQHLARQAALYTRQHLSLPAMGRALKSLYQELLSEATTPDKGIATLPTTS
ncbi:glycosyltransferase [Roseimicrobium sp. ORNL1]|nr:glycosyltransferase [Roseimicrobium sp. ORNL1]QIF04491.1 glycosyltransferase [Roseimicrobium sp. ORNL1]